MEGLWLEFDSLNDLWIHYTAFSITEKRSVYMYTILFIQSILGFGYC